MPHRHGTYTSLTHIHIYSVAYIPYIFTLRSKTALAAASQRRALRPSGRDIFSQQNERQQQKQSAKERKVFVLFFPCHSRTKIIKLALCKTRQKLYKLDNFAAVTVVVVRHCCSTEKTCGIMMTTTSLQATTLLPPSPAVRPTLATASTINGTSAVQQQRRHLLHSVESLRARVHQVLKCVINLHIEFLVIGKSLKSI